MCTSSSAAEMEKPLPPLICGACEPEADAFPQYQIDDWRGCGIWRKVLCHFDAGLTPEQARTSLLGAYGHLERSAVYTHLVPAALFFLYFVIRPATPQGRVDTEASAAVAAAVLAFSSTFFISSVYHVYSASRVASAITRLLDYGFIYFSMAVGGLSDLAAVSVNNAGTTWQSGWDIFLALFLMVTFWSVRRYVLPISETRKPYFASKCSLGFARHMNVDLAHSSLRAAAGVCIAYAWVLSIGPAYSNLERHCANALLATRLVAVALLVAGMAVDNLVLFPDGFADDTKPLSRCVCYSRRAGCVMSSHALWHVLSAVSVLANTIGSEYVILSSEKLNA